MKRSKMMDRFRLCRKAQVHFLQQSKQRTQGKRRSITEYDIEKVCIVCYYYNAFELSYKEKNTLKEDKEEIKIIKGGDGGEEG